MNRAPTMVGFAPNCGVGAQFIAPLFVAPMFIVCGSITKLARRLIFIMHAPQVYHGAIGRNELRPYDVGCRGAIHCALVVVAGVVLLAIGGSS